MARASARPAFRCGACGEWTPRWVGRCPGCGAWDSLHEAPSGEPAQAARRALAAVPEPVRLGDLADADAGVGIGAAARLSTGIPELDRVLGGGLVAGSVVLLGGEPGIGKSTLALQMLARIPGSLLITGEESLAQVRGRAERLEESAAGIAALAETRLEAVVAAIDAHRPAACVVDSVQTLRSDAIDAGPGSVAQVRLAADALVRVAKQTGVALVLVGQVTKDGTLAGPRTLEHLVDAVLSFEGDHLRAQRVLRATKNRFGATDETGVFAMGAHGLRAVADPSRLYLGDLIRSPGAGAGADADAGAETVGRVGSCIFPTIEGSRALLVEVQALVGPTELVPPRRVAGGVDRTRLAQVIAVLARHAGLRLGDQDVFVSVAGGARAQDPAADLALALAIASGLRGVALPVGTVAFGELGLTGAVRPVGHLERRLQSAAAHGMSAAVVPERIAGDDEPRGSRPPAVHPVAGVREALDAAFGR